jgi:hypothetical protein
MKFKPYRGHHIIRTSQNFFVQMHAFKNGKEVASARSRRELEIKIDRLCGPESATTASDQRTAVLPCAGMAPLMGGDTKAGKAGRT